MKRLILLSGLLALSFKPIDSKVYVCKSESSVAYHATTDCRGLKRCTHEVVTVTIDEARQMGKRACKICY